MELDRVTVIVPSYNPDEKLCETVRALREAGFSDIVVVDDGSAPDKKKNFPKEGDGVTLLTHEVNRGKGAAMKNAFRFVLENRPNCVGVVTVDGDGQHRPSDVVACVSDMLEGESAIVLGARDFSLDNVPERSRKGNRITSRVFKILFGMKISDTQTGLRAISREYLESLCAVSGDRYEYETNMLIAMKRENIPFREVKIETVYIDDNQTSHFRPVRDSIRIYGLIVAFALSSVISAVIDIGLFTLFNVLFSNLGIKFSYALAVALARVVSSAVNYAVNRRVVFGRGSASSVGRYYILAAGLLASSALCGQAITHLLKITLPVIETLVKAAIDLILFVLSFRIQHEWVFRNKK